MKTAALVIIAAPLILAACATIRPSAQVRDAHAKRAVKACVAHAWMHDGLIPNRAFTSWDWEANWQLHHGGARPILGPPDIGEIQRQCQ